MGQLKNPPPDRLSAHTDHDAQADDTAPEDDRASALSAFGLVADGPLPTPDAGGIAWLWPDNVAHWNAWVCVQTQWRYTSGGMGAPVATGLDYAAVTAWLQAQGHHPRRRGSRSLPAALYAIAACEQGALQGMAQARQNSAR